MRSSTHITLLILIAITMMALCLIRIDEVCKVQADTLLELQAHREQMEQPVVEPVAQESEPVSLSMTAEETELIARVIMAEARGSGVDGMMAVAQTIYDRSVLWGKTPTEVVTAPKQYASPYKGEISEDAIKAVTAVFCEGERVWEEPTTHFYSEKMDIPPYWTEGKVNRGSRGGNSFWY